MVRTRTGVASQAAKKRIFKRAKGFWGGKHRLWRTVKEAVVRADAFAYRDRRNRKRDFRRLWIARISAAVEQRGMKYSRFIHGLKRAEIDLNRKVLAEVAILDPELFDQIVERAQTNL